MSEPEGACGRTDCPVGSGVGSCVLDKALLDCDNFEPEPDLATPTPTREDLPHTEEPEIPLEADKTEELTVESSAFTRPSDIDAASETLDSRRRVRKPEGPKNTVHFDDGPAVIIRSGLALTVDEARNVMAEEPVEIIVFAAPPDAGKTTLLAAVFENLLSAPIGNWSFAGSRTLLAFAMRSWWATTASGRTSPITPRTRRGDSTRPWLHLRLTHADHPSEVRSLLFADLSGEYFSTIAGGGSLEDAASIVSRADHVLHVLDSELLIERSERLRALSAAEGLLRRMVTTPHVRDGARHSIVMTKADICPPDFKAQALARAETWSDRWLDGSKIVEVAARPDDHNDHPWGLDALLDRLLIDSRSSPEPQSADHSFMLRVGALTQSGINVSVPIERTPEV